MPSRKPLVAMKKMPGTMMTSETRKNQWRRLMMSSFRRRGSTGGCGLAISTAASAGDSFGGSTAAGSGSSSSGAALPSDVSSTVYPQQARPPESAGREHDREEVVGHDDRRDQAGDDANAERDCKALHLGRPNKAEDDAGDERRGV